MIAFKLFTFFLSEITEKLFEERRSDGGGGYVGEDIDNAYEEEVEQKEMDEKKKVNRPVAVIGPYEAHIDVFDNSTDLDESPIVV